MAVQGSRVEINFCRLLTRCEGMVASEQQADWRLEKYINSLYDYLAQLRKMSANAPSTESLNEYTRRVELLRGIIEASKLSSAAERCQAVDLLVPSNQMVTTSSGSHNLHAQTKARFEKEVRDELLNSSGSQESDTTVRQRNIATSDESLDTFIKHQAEVQGRIAEEMLHLTRSLKQNVMASGHIVREDNKKLQESSNLVDVNHAKLKLESDRLDAHVKRACSSWILIVLVIVCVTFIWMVLFMKMFPKK